MNNFFYLFSLSYVYELSYTNEHKIALMLKELLQPEIKELIDNRNWLDLKDILQYWPAPEIADLLLNIEKHDRVLLFRALPRDISAEVFAHLDNDQRDSLLYDLSDGETRELLEDLSPDDRTDLLEELPGKVTRRLLNMLNPEDLKEARQLLGYPEDSVGRQMTPDFVAVKKDWTVKKAIDHIRKFGKDKETIYRIYVTGKGGILLDDILLKDIMIATDEKRISELMDDQVVALSAFEDQEEAVIMMEKYDLFALPVIDSQGVLVGIVTFDDVMDISAEEATEDFQKISGINPVDQSYISASTFKLWGKRFPWLFGLLVTNFFTAGLIMQYEEVLGKFLILSAFIPVLIGTAGNSGTQSSTLIIRSLATQELAIGDWWKVLKKELTVGFFLGLILSIISFGGGLLAGEGNVAVSLVLCFSMITVIIWANIVGSLLPLIIEKLKFDPAVISSPFIATVIDLTGIFIYFSIAMTILDL